MNGRRASLGISKTPTLGRILLAVLALAGLGPTAARAESLREEEVILLARSRDLAALAAREAVSLAAAQEVEAGLYPNPVLDWSREQIGGSGGPGLLGSEEALAVTVPIESSHRRRARRSLARAGTATARSDAARAQSRAVARALLVFYEALAAQQRVEIARRHLDRLAEATRVLERRHLEGTASGYERIRVELEAELAGSELREAAARELRHRQELALLLALAPGSVELAGELAPAAAPESPPDALSEAAGSLLSLDLLRASLAYLGSAKESAERAWLPGISLTGGLRRAIPEEARQGFVVGISVPLPLLSRGQELRAEAEARYRFLEAQLQSAEQSARIEILRAVGEFTLSNEELARFDETTAERTARLIRAAESGYREGRMSILELLDAERARAAVELRRLDLALAARRAEIALRAARGDFE